MRALPRCPLCAALACGLVAAAALWAAPVAAQDAGVPQGTGMPPDAGAPAAETGVPADEPPPPDYDTGPTGPPDTPPGYEQAEQPPPPPPPGETGGYGQQPPAPPPPTQPGPPPSHAQPPPAETIPPEEREGYHEHDGLYLRLAVGPAYTRAVESIDDGDVLRIQGGGPSFGFAIGGTVANTVILGGELFASVAALPDVDERLPGEPWNDVDGVNVFSATGLGVHAAFYLSPLELFFSGTFGFGVATIETDTSIGETDVGFAMSLRAGKDWWVGGDWAIGAGLQFMYFLLPDSDKFLGDRPRLNVFSIAPTVSATFN